MEADKAGPSRAPDRPEGRQHAASAPSWVQAVDRLLGDADPHAGRLRLVAAGQGPHRLRALVGQLRERLPCLPDSVPEARRLVGRLGAPDLGEAALVVSELVTNAVRHGCTGAPRDIELRLLRLPGALRVEVELLGPISLDPERVLRARFDDETGWGLFLVDRLSRSWGIEGAGCVWAEIPWPGRSGG